MAADQRRVPPMSFIAQMLRDDARLAALRDEQLDREDRSPKWKPLFSSTAIAVVLMLASRVNRKDFTAWPSLVTLAADCRLNEKSIRRYRQAISIFFDIEGGTYVFKSPEEYEQDIESLVACNADRGSNTPDRGSKTPDRGSMKRTVGPKKRTDGPTNSKEPVKEPEKEPENRTLPRGGSAVSMPSGLSDLTNANSITPSMTPVAYEERLTFLRRQAAMEN